MSLHPDDDFSLVYPQILHPRHSINVVLLFQLLEGALLTSEIVVYVMEA